MVPRLSSMGRQAALQAPAAFSSAASSRREPISAFAAGSTSSTVGATAPSPTRAAVQTPPFKVRLTPTPTTAISISVRGIMRRYASLEPGGRGGSVKLTRISPGLRLVRPGLAGTCSTGNSRRPPGPGPRQPHDGAAGAHGGHAVSGRRAVAQITARGSPPLHLLGADQIDGFEHTGPDLAEARMFGQLHARDGRTHTEAAIDGFLDAGHLGNFLDIDNQGRPDDAGAHLHQKIGPASQDASGTACRRKCTDRFIKRLRCHVSDFGHGFPDVSLMCFCLVLCVFLAHLVPGCRPQAYTGENDPNSVGGAA